METSDWQRATSPEQKEQRREAILEAAAALLQNKQIADISIGEVAQQAGIAKGSVYRYFATREEVFLGLLVRDLAGWFDALAERLAPADPLDARALAALLVDTLRPRAGMLRLLSRLFSDIEQNLSVEAAREFKQFLLERVGETGARLEAVLPGLSPGDGGRLILRLNALVAGLWPMAHPAGSIEKALAAPSMAPLRVDFDTELGATLEAMLVGMVMRPAEKKKRGSK